MGYWDLEEGKDCVDKTWITTKIATAIGKSDGYLGVLMDPLSVCFFTCAMFIRSKG